LTRGSLSNKIGLDIIKLKYFVTKRPNPDQITKSPKHDIMMHEVRILNLTKLNHDVIQFHLEKPRGYNFTAGQAIELSTTQEPKHGPAPFTFTGLNSHNYLELTIKIYEEHHGLTAALSRLSPGDTVMITNPWDAFINRGPGIFIAGGAGVTPFIALLRKFKVEGKVGDSQLIFFNKTWKDVFMHDELRKILGNKYVDVITRKNDGEKKVEVDAGLLGKYITIKNEPVYVCGSPGFMDTIQTILPKLGAPNELVNISL
jgi:ferredoxin-NADP reductase